MRIASLFTCMVVVSLLCAAPAFANVTVFSDNFSNYDIGGPPGGNWCDWATGVSALAEGMTTAVVVSDGNGGKCLYQVNNSAYSQTGEVVAWFANPFDVVNRSVTMSYDIKGDPGHQNEAANQPSWASQTFGSLGPVGGVSETEDGTYYAACIVQNGDWDTSTWPATPGKPGLTTTWYNNWTDASSECFVTAQDGVTWNHVSITAVVTSITDAGMTGWATFTITHPDQTEPGGVFSFTSPKFAISLGPEGLNGVDLWSSFNGDGSAAWYVTNIDVVQGGIVPEPATMSLLVLGGLAMLRRRRK